MSSETCRIYAFNAHHGSITSPKNWQPDTALLHSGSNSFFVCISFSDLILVSVFRFLTNQSQLHSSTESYVFKVHDKQTIIPPWLGIRSHNQFRNKLIDVCCTCVPKKMLNASLNWNFIEMKHLMIMYQYHILGNVFLTTQKQIVHEKKRNLCLTNHSIRDGG